MRKDEMIASIIQRRNYDRNNELYHHGILGQKWGIRRYQNLDGTLTTEGKDRYRKHNSMHELGKKSLTSAATPKELFEYLQHSISYKEFTALQSPEDTVKSKAGSCHDQVVLELNELKARGIDAKARFVMEYNPENSQVGMTHSYVYYNNNGKTYWLENAWEGHEGIHEIKTIKDVENYIAEAHKNKSFGENSSYSLEFSDFGEHRYGENLQEFVDVALNTET